MSGTVPEALDVAERIKDTRAPDVRLRALDQLAQRLAARISGNVVMPPQLLEDPLGDLSDQGDGVLRVAVAE
ncbi:hypothetical protein ABGB14_26705 [Nonomuraea sp. B10E15]|uniref:hypothetical protein n=1 Tax=Nonomuraea sp. B10E15 TaxID=3153560 RepID=UPI00325D4FB5